MKPHDICHPIAVNRGGADLSSNPFEQITRQLSVLYHENPAVTNMNGDIEDLTSREET